jgi:hypothetical protein
MQHSLSILLENYLEFLDFSNPFPFLIMYLQITYKVLIESDADVTPYEDDVDCVERGSLSLFHVILFSF